MDMMRIGLFIIAIAWLVQLVMVYRGDKSIQKLFVILYIIGVLFLVINAFNVGLVQVAWFELGTLIAAGLVLIKLLVK